MFVISAKPGRITINGVVFDNMVEAARAVLVALRTQRPAARLADAAAVLRPYRAMFYAGGNTQ